MTSNKPRFTIVIPTLNEAKALPFLLKDLVHQTQKNFSTVIVDGRSSDGTPEKAQAFADKLDLKLITSPTRNAGFQRNLGAKNTTAEFIIFLDADSRIPKYFIQEIDLAATKASRKFHLAATWIKADTDSDLDNFMAGIYNQLLILNKDIAPAAQATGLIVRRRLFHRVKGFNPQLTFAEDRDLIKRICKMGYKIIILKSPLLTFSFRRFRRKGYGNTVAKLLYLNIYATLRGAPPPEKIKYEMGGNY